MSSCERTGWRDQWISQRKRTWGNLPCVDIDAIITAGGEDMHDGGWPVVEYDDCTPYALIEYKALGATINLKDANNTALRRLADMAGLPFFLVVYNQKNARFLVVPGNDPASNIHQHKRVYNERDYVGFLRRLPRYRP